MSLSAAEVKQSSPVLLSILIPAYNRPEMLSELLTSLETVTVTDCEILVVDDASPQDLGPVIASHASRDGRIIYVRNASNVGPTANFNKAISLSRGRYFTILGDDETVLPGNFEKKLAVLEAYHEIGLVYSGHFYVDACNEQRQLAAWPGMLDYSYIGGRDEFADLFPFNYISLHSVLYRRSLWERYGGFDEQITECGNDWEMNLRYCFHTQTAYIDEPLLNVRLHDGSTTSKLGVLQSKLAQGRIQVWRKWLVDRPQPYVLGPVLWHQLQARFELDVNHWFGKEAEQVQRWLGEFDRLKSDAHRAAGQALSSPSLRDGG